ncbi:MAG: hypothetical protein ABI042_15020 [Verrucomicrobiota bacterium]
MKRHFCIYYILILGIVCQISAPAAVRYVDNSLTNSANNGISWANAWTNFQSVSGVSGGDTIYISGGSTSKVYSYAADFSGTTWNIPSGTINNPVSVRIGQDVGHNGVAIFDATSTNLDSIFTFQSYQLISGNYNGATNFLFRNISHTASRDYGHAINGAGAHTTIEYCAVTNAQNGFKVGGSGGLSDVEIRYCSLVSIYGDHALQANTGNAVLDDIRLHHLYILTDVNNTTNGAGQYIDMGGPDSFQVGSGCTIHDTITDHRFSSYPNLGQHPDNIQGGGNHMRIYNNTFYSPPGAVFSNLPDDRLYDWVIWNNQFINANTNFNVTRVFESGYVSVVNVISNFYWLNNTIVDFPIGISQVWQQIINPAQYPYTNQPIVTNYVVQNNIFYNTGGEMVIGFGSYRNSKFSKENILFSSNLTTPGSKGATRAGFATSAPLSYINPSYAYWYQSVSLTNAPTWVSHTSYARNSDLHLAATDSAATTRGTNLTSLFSSLGIPTADKDGVLRPTTGSWDIGAYQNKKAISPPVNLRVSPPKN